MIYNMKIYILNNRRCGYLCKFGDRGTSNAVVMMERMIFFVRQIANDICEAAYGAFC